jgi:hypothetical protein
MLNIPGVSSSLEITVPVSLIAGMKFFLSVTGRSGCP